MTLINDSGSFAATGSRSDASSSSTGAGEQAKQAAGSAAEETKHVADFARAEAQQVVAEAKSQTHHLLGEATSQIENQSRTQRDQFVGTLRTFSDDLDQMANRSEGGLATSLVQQTADRARALTARLDGREPGELLDDVRSFARRKPGTFLLGAVAAGAIVGRLSRGAKAAQSNSNDDTVVGQAGQVGYPTVGTDTDPIFGSTLAAKAAAPEPSYVSDVPVTRPLDPSAPLAGDPLAGGTLGSGESRGDRR